MRCEVLELLKEIFGEELSADAAARIESWLNENYQPKTSTTESEEPVRQAEEKTLADEILAAEAAAYEQAKAEFDQQVAELRFDYALNVALLQVGVIDLDLIKVKLDKTALSLGENGEIIGLAEQLAEVRERFPMLFTKSKSSIELFGVKPAAVAEPESVLTREELDQMNYKQRVQLLHNNPTLYHSLLG